MAASQTADAFWKELLPYPTIWSRSNHSLCEETRSEWYSSSDTSILNLSFWQNPNSSSINSAYRKRSPQHPTKNEILVLWWNIIIILMTYSWGSLRKTKEWRTHLPTNKTRNSKEVKRVPLNHPAEKENSHHFWHFSKKNKPQDIVCLGSLWFLLCKKVLK